MSMMHEITSAVPRYKRGLRKGRGEGSGHGKTSGRGTKGAKARQGQPYWKPGHEGGQTPLHRRLPARGFSNAPFRRDWQIINVADLERFPDATIVDGAALATAGLVDDPKGPIKILGDGALTRKLTVQVGWYSKAAFQKIQAAGGTPQNITGETFAFPKPKHRPKPQQKGAKPQPKSAKAAAKAEPAEVEKPAEIEKPAEVKET